MANFSKLDLERLRVEISEEHKMKDILEQSCQELERTIEELEKRYENVEDENNEWRTRFEIQCEINKQLANQIDTLQNKIAETRDALKPGPGGKPDVARVMALEGGSSAVTPSMIRLLEREKHNLTTQIKDLEWRTDLESKAYHKAVALRKKYRMDINSTARHLFALKSQPPQAKLGLGVAGPGPSSFLPRHPLPPLNGVAGPVSRQYTSPPSRPGFERGLGPGLGSSTGSGSGPLGQTTPQSSHSTSQSVGSRSHQPQSPQLQQQQQQPMPVPAPAAPSRALKNGAVRSDTLASRNGANT